MVSCFFLIHPTARPCVMGMQRTGTRPGDRGERQARTHGSSKVVVVVVVFGRVVAAAGGARGSRLVVRILVGGCSSCPAWATFDLEDLFVFVF